MWRKSSMFEREVKGGYAGGVASCKLAGDPTNMRKFYGKTVRGGLLLKAIKGTFFSDETPEVLACAQLCEYITK